VHDDVAMALLGIDDHFKGRGALDNTIHNLMHEMKKDKIPGRHMERVTQSYCDIAL